MRCASKNVWTQKDTRNTETFIVGAGVRASAFLGMANREG